MIRRPTSRLLAATAAVIALAACDEENISLASGDPSTLDVMVFVDANGNGSFDAGDEAISDISVTATGPVSLTATTNADGTASFADLAPGAYTLAATGSVPEGAVLASAGNPNVVAPFQGAALEAQFRYAFEPGSITGRLFRDDNANGAFDAGVDLAAAGITVTATRVSDDAEFSTTTDAQGAFEIPTLRPAAYMVTFGLPSDAQVVGGSPVTVEVGANVEFSLNAVFEGDLLIDIAEAREAPLGQSVTVEGVITWAPDFDTRALFVQDETGGLSVFDFNLPAGLAIGDRVRMTGAAGQFDGERQLSPLSAFEVLSSGPAPVPVPVTAAEIAAGENLGELVSINGTVEQIDVLSFGNQMILLRDGDGTTFAVKVDSRTGVTEADWSVGQLFGVVGVLGTDVSESGTDIDDLHPNRVEVRGPDDVQPGGVTVDIADARNAVGVTVAIEGVITWVPDFDDRVLFIQDATGGITTFDFDLSDFAPMGGFQRGQRIRAVADVGAFRGEIQLGSFQSVDVLGTVPVPTPEGVTGASINGGDDQAELATITATVDQVEVLSFGNQLVTMTDGAGTSFSVFVDSRTGISDTDWTVGARYRVTGVLGFDDRNTPSARLEPREPGDQVLMPGTAVSIAEARALFGEAVTVSGTVSRALGWTDRQAFIQDVTGGIALFTFDGLPALAPGDMVTVTGDVGAFGGEIQIGPDAVTVDGSGPAPAALVVSGEQINGGLFQGRLVQLSGSVSAVEQVNDFGSANVTLVDADGTSVRVFVDNRSGLAVGDFAVGQELVIVGVPGFFDQNDPGAQLEVIVDTDVTFVN